ncbi:serine hydrolase [bacterium]|nr:serine hydrolase [bacterium]
MRVQQSIVPIVAIILVFTASSLWAQEGDVERRPQIGPMVHSIVHSWIEKEQPPGVIVVVRHHGETTFFPFGEADRGRGIRVTPDSIFELASVTKVFTTTSLAMELEEGRMRLESPLADYAPFLDRQGGDIKRVTLLHLATHTSSLPRVPEVRRLENEWNKRLIMEWAAHWRANEPPGSKYLYSNVAMGLLGYAIENVEQKPLGVVFHEQFLNALSMHHTFFEIPRNERHLVVQGYGHMGHPVEHSPIGGWPAGGRLSSSGRDMGEFLRANLGEREDLPKITKAMRIAQEPHFKVSDQLSLGLAWQRVKLQGELVIDKNGGLPGTSTYIGMLPERKVGVVVMANRGKCHATGVGRKLLFAIAGKEHLGEEEDEE